MKLGVEVLLSTPSLLASLKAPRVALLGHPASVTHSLQHSLDALMAGGVNIRCGVGPQHGMRGAVQDNMMETTYYVDPKHNIPVHSLYGESRKLTDEMLADFDILLVDLQDVGTRIYTYVTTLFWAMEACAKAGKAIWVLDRPNPAGRPIEGHLLRDGFYSFVGAAPIPMRHGMTLGELALWYQAKLGLDLDLQLIEMEGYQPELAPGYGWPVDLAWVNPSPNAANLNMARCFPGTVLLEGTTLSEGRGTTRPLEVVGAPDIDAETILNIALDMAPTWWEGATVRMCWFEPTFHKHHHQLCSGLMFHTDLPSYEPQRFKPYRAMASFLKALRLSNPDYVIWRDFEYEYEKDRLAIDLINGSDELRQWVDAPESTVADYEAMLRADESAWEKQRAPYLRYA